MRKTNKIHKESRLMRYTLRIAGGNIIQIMPVSPTNSIVAVYSDGDRIPVVCWALIEEIDEGEIWKDVVGMVIMQQSKYLVFVDEEDTAEDKFVEYEYE